MNASKILEKNASTIDEIFTGINTGNWYDGLSYQIYLDTNDGEIMIRTEPSGNTWHQRDDGSLVHIMSVSGYTDMPDEDRYDPATCSKYDFGWQDFLCDMEERIERALE